MSDLSYKVRFIADIWLSEDEEAGGTWGIYAVTNLADNRRITIKGKLPKAAREYGNEFEIAGASPPIESPNPKYRKNGPTVTFKIYYRSHPVGQHGVVSFLQRAAGIGIVTANKLWERYGDSTIETILADPGRIVADFPEIKEELIMEASLTLNEEYADAKYKLPLIDLFKGTLVPITVVDRVCEMRLGDPLEAIKENPFILMQCRGVGFVRADSVREKLQLDRESPQRVRAAFQEVLDNSSDQVWVSKKKFFDEAHNLLGLEARQFGPIVRDLIAEEKIAICEMDGEQWLASADHFGDELSLSMMLADKMKSPMGDTAWPIERIKAQTDLRDDQREVIMHNMEVGGKVLVLAGPPGSGKTFALTRILAALLQEGYTVAAAAPTGKAAQRLTGCLREAGIGLVATTIHRLLCPQPVGGGFRFSDAKLQFDVIAIDETSMCNNWLARALMNACVERTLIIFVGDRNQLPPVGPGTMMRDLQELGYRELEKPIRNNGQIVEVCSRIRSGDEYPIHHEVDEPTVDRANNVQWVGVSDDDLKARVVQSIVSDMQSGKIEYGIHDVQFMTATHDNGRVGRKVMNEFLQESFNPNGGGEHAIFRVGDKVINTFNSLYKTTAGGNILVANGEMGIVTESYRKHILVELSGAKEVVRVPCGVDGGAWDLGYCITVHKAQGSEWPITVTLVGSEFRDDMVIGREWLYTAISRSKVTSIVIAGHHQITNAVRRCRIWDRKSKMLEYWRILNDENLRAGVDLSSRYTGTAAVEFRWDDSRNWSFDQAAATESDSPRFAMW